MATVDDEVLGARQATQDRVSKIELLRRLFPHIDAGQYADRIASVDVRADKRAIIHFHEDDRLDIEPQHKRVRQFGVGDHAKALAMALADSTLSRFYQHPDDDWGRGKSPASPIKLAVMSREHADIIAARWRERGYSEVTVSPRGVLVEVDEGAWLRDRDTEAHLHGKMTDVAIKALMLKAATDWNGRIELIGTEDYKARAWAIAQEVGVTVVGYEPPESLLDGGRRPSNDAHPEVDASAKAPGAATQDPTSSAVPPVPSPTTDTVTGPVLPIAPKPLKATTTVISPAGSRIVASEASKNENMATLLAASNDDDYDVEPFNDNGPSF